MDRAKLLKQIKSVIAVKGPTQPTIVTASRILELIEQELEVRPFTSSNFITRLESRAGKDSAQVSIEYKIGKASGISEKLRNLGYQVQEDSGLITATIKKDKI